MKKVKSFGCSFSFGTDLPDINNNQPSKLTWPALVANHLDLKYECYAVGGCGNLQILENILNQAPIEDQSLFLISWTWIDRFDYFNHEDACWQTVRPDSENSVSKNYYMNLHSEYHDKLLNLSYIQAALEILNRKKIPFVMTHLDELLLDHRWYSTMALRHLQLNAQKYLTTFEGRTFLDWSRAHGFAESPTWHPLEQAHRAAADYMIEHLKGKI